MTSVMRIRIALDYSPLNPAAMAWTASLARRLQAQMEARFIEDLELFQIAELPFTRCGPGQFDVQTLGRQMQEQALRLEGELRELVAREELSLQFSRVRGHLLEEIRRAGEDVGLLVLQGFQPSRPRLGQQAMVQSGETAMVLFDGSKQAAAALKLALQSLPAESLYVLIQAQDRSQATQTLAQLQALAGQAGVAALRTGFLPLHDGEHLLHLARLERPAAVFLASNNTLLADHPLRELISVLPCPLAIGGQAV